MLRVLRLSLTKTMKKPTQQEEETIIMENEGDTSQQPSRIRNCCLNVVLNRTSKFSKWKRVPLTSIIFTGVKKNTRRLRADTFLFAFIPICFSQNFSTSFCSLHEIIIYNWLFRSGWIGRMYWTTFSHFPAEEIWRNL